MELENTSHLLFSNVILKNISTAYTIKNKGHNSRKLMKYYQEKRTKYALILDSSV